eukprot:1137908-Pelagomonas_calceolata.AAC.4
MAPLDTTHPGYQAPLPADQVQPIQEDEVWSVCVTQCVRVCLGVFRCDVNKHCASAFIKVVLPFLPASATDAEWSMCNQQGFIGLDSTTQSWELGCIELLLPVLPSEQPVSRGSNLWEGHEGG